MADPIIPPAGISAASFPNLPTFADPARPPVILADAVNTKTGEWESILAGRHPVDAAIVEAFRLRRGTGAAVLNEGSAFQKIKKKGSSVGRELEDEARLIMAPFVERGDARIDEIGIDTESAEDLGGVFVAYVNLRTLEPQKVP